MARSAAHEEAALRSKLGSLEGRWAELAEQECMRPRIDRAVEYLKTVAPQEPRPVPQVQNSRRRCADGGRRAFEGGPSGDFSGCSGHDGA
eukprot:5143376-Pyramimonas_sp.AAC.1